MTFATRENDGLVSRRSGSRLDLAIEGGRASRAVDDFPHPCGWLPSPARAEGTESRRFRWLERKSPNSTRLEHLLVTDCVRGSLESPSTRPTSRRHDRRFVAREGHERCDRIEMLSVVHHSFARVRIAPRHARVEPGRPSSR